MDREPHVEHALAEIEIGELYGDADAVLAGEKRLAAAGHKRAAAAEPDQQKARTAAPKGRTSRQNATAQAMPTTSGGSGSQTASTTASSSSTTTGPVVTSNAEG